MAIDFITELQLKSLEIIQREHLEKEYLSFMNRGTPSKYTLIYFLIWYAEMEEEKKENGK